MPDKIRTHTDPIGIVGGTGYYTMEMEEQEQLHEETPFGTFTASSGFVEGKRVIFVARHGMRHKFLPHEVNYRANIYALKKLGVRQVFSFCMAGTLSKEFGIGDIVIPDQFIDLTHGRPNTFFGEGNSVYVSMADPFCPGLSSFASGELNGAGIKTHLGGTYVCVQGPHFSTRAESRFYSGFGDIIGMTAATEAKLAREAGLCYTVLASIVDHDTCGMGMKDMRYIVTSANLAARRLVRHVLVNTSCNCAGSMTGSVISRTGPLDAVVGRSSARSMFND
jgi:5'-methylthioadenosine phosphorylase